MAAWKVRRDSEPTLQTRRRRQALVLWFTWLIVPLVYFSISLFYHRYYLSTMAPAIAALAGIGAWALWSAWQASGRQRWWLIGALVGCGSVQALILIGQLEWGLWLVPIVLGLVFVASLTLIVLDRVRPDASQRWAHGGFICGVLALLIAPTVWALIPVATCTDMTLPIAGPQAKECRTFKVRPFLDLDLIAYLRQNRDGAEYLAATYDMGIAELGILETGEPFMALGGYRGSDPILTVDEFSRLVATGEVRLFLGMEDAGEQWSQQEAIRRWVEEHCPPSSFQSQGIMVQGPCFVDQ